MSNSTAADLLAKLVPQPDELRHESTTNIAHMVESLGYAIDQLTLGPYGHETSNAIGGLAEAVRLLSKVLRNRVTESRSG